MGNTEHMWRPSRVVFWDVDGTLLDLDGAGVRAFNAAARELFGPDANLDQIPWPGKTDLALARLFTEHYRAPATALPRLIDAYLLHLSREVEKAGPLIPGVEAFLERLAGEESIISGLLTGNLRRGAELKLRRSGLMHYFRFGAFADDAEVRIDLAPVALQRAAEAGVIVPGPENRILVGDTLHDLECARVLGARMLAISTEAEIRERLKKAGADKVVADFRDAGAILRWMLS